MSQEQDMIIYTRPEIRKGSMWDIRLIFSKSFLEQHNIKQLYLEKPKISKDGAYLCIKVRSKLLKKELGFNKVADIENDKPFLTINESGTTVLKVKFTQRPRSVFHKHADVMILVVSVRSVLTGAILTTNDHELIFRGGTGSIHSADSKKRQSLANSTSSKSEMEEESTTSEHDSYGPPPRKKMASDINNTYIKSDPYNNINMLDQSFDYFGMRDELRESLQLEEWAKQYGIDPPLIENEMTKYISPQNDIFGYDSLSTYQHENKITANEHYNSMLRLKEEIRDIIDKKIEEFSLAIEKKLEKQRKEIERIVNSSLLNHNHSTQSLDTNKLMCSLKMK